MGVGYEDPSTESGKKALAEVAYLNSQSDD